MRLRNTQINPIVKTWSYSKILEVFGNKGEAVAKLAGVSKPKRKKKTEEEGE